MYALRLSSAIVAVTAVALIASAMAGSGAGCGPVPVIWVCDDPATGKEDPSIHDDSHYVNGVPDPCHCYDPCGPAPTCPIVVDAGPPCDAGADSQ